MMSIYARIDGGIVAEIIEPLLDGNGNEIPAAERFTPELVRTLVDVTSLVPIPAQGWAYDGSTFTGPSS